MTQQQYIQNGYRVSASLAQDFIDRAEDDVKEAYIKPILPNADCSTGVAQKCFMQLAFILMVRRSAIATRSGGKINNPLNSQNLTEEQALSEFAATAHMYIEQLRKEDGANVKAKVNDICGIYFSTNYFGG